MTRKAYTIALLVIAMPLAKAQYALDTVADSLLTRHLHMISRSADSMVHNPDAFVSGRLYYPRGNKDDHPFFPDFSWQTGIVEYDGNQYPVAMLKYDIENDVLVMMKIIDNLGYTIQLDKRAIPEFSIEDHHFVLIEGVRKSGYYERLYDGRTRVWFKRTKWQREVENPVFGKSMYVVKTYHAVQLGGEFHDVKSLKDIYHVFSDKKREIRAFKRDNKLSFRKDRSNAIIMMTEHYDNLNN